MDGVHPYSPPTQTRMFDAQSGSICERSARCLRAGSKVHSTHPISVAQTVPASPLSIGWEGMVGWDQSTYVPSDAQALPKMVWTVQGHKQIRRSDLPLKFTSDLEAPQHVSHVALVSVLWDPWAWNKSSFACSRAGWRRTQMESRGGSSLSASRKAQPATVPCPLGGVSWVAQLIGTGGKPADAEIAKTIS